MSDQNHQYRATESRGFTLGVCNSVAAIQTLANLFQFELKINKLSEQSSPKSNQQNPLENEIRHIYAALDSKDTLVRDTAVYLGFLWQRRQIRSTQIRYSRKLASAMCDMIWDKRFDVSSGILTALEHQDPMIKVAASLVCYWIKLIAAPIKGWALPKPVSTKLKELGNASNCCMVRAASVLAMEADKPGYRACEIFLEWLENQNSEIRRAGAWGLSRAVCLLPSYRVADIREGLHSALTDTDEEVRFWAQNGLDKLVDRVESSIHEFDTTKSIRRNSPHEITRIAQSRSTHKTEQSELRELR